MIRFYIDTEVAQYASHSRFAQLSRDGVVAAAAPGIAAEDALEAEPEPFKGTVFAESLESILGAGGGEPAAGRLERRDAQLIKLYQQEKRCREYSFKQLHPVLPKRF